ncbi:DUF2505 domain-containing protein [Rhodococcus sp. WS1]|jgi:hypothetical protein|uniref:DUF2505 domain-containing protein n=2 Tax=Rhodococcus erythropolis TaxID=1833 RepID=A0A1F2Q9V5_RHOER|nr:MULTISPECIES: DUF2505 domain-containing protein [Rhodococcus]MDZ7911180.1 DUF2505 domain-containing protein [Rhodococcus sp. (in: high G+C Gram-positive bacteria)]AGT91398.1 hypothetical protein O5Y_07635 [Rhodococcus erythropolis CCM2595]ALU72271.1 hypothetical protein H351_24760 [Rhodococcus erythropolis R138]ATI34282.1 DUF2505 domain-containing protein [Rhodococcus sp. H-CA8f]EQM31178.1 hypothetical protein N601_23320 [Rhodococcus erythropolis DN1]
MARRIDYSARYQHSPEQVYAALADRSYWEARVEEMRKHSENHVEHFEVTDSGIDLVLHHILPRTDLPDIAQTVMKKDLVITRKESYGAFGDTVTGTYEASIPAGPGNLSGTMELFATDTGSTLRTTSEAKVFIPFIGAKLEQLMLINLVDLFRTEAQVTATWLAAR